VRIVSGFGLSLLLLACSSAAPAPDYQTEEPPARSGGGKTPAPPPAMTDSASSDAPDGSACETVPPNNRCGLSPQCGCGSNETCDVTSSATGATSCVSAGGGTQGRPCASTGDCLAGLTCQYGICRPYCAKARASCSAPGTGLCVEVLDGNDKPVPNVTICTIDCDPRVPSAACGANTCIWFDTYYSPEKVSDCNFPGTIDAQTPCQNVYDCKPGLACATHPKYGLECERWCRIGNDADCAASGAAFKCVDYFGANAPVESGVKEGVCQD
jgi:hypothetical protein